MFAALQRDELVQEVSVSGVLDGIRVLDFDRYIAGPFCAAVLGYLGAEVIPIERMAAARTARSSRSAVAVFASRRRR